MNPQIVIPLTREQFEAARARLAQEQHIYLFGDSGDIEGHKVGITFNYDGATLALTIEHKPMFYPEAAVEAEIRKWFTEA